MVVKHIALLSINIEINILETIEIDVQKFKNNKNKSFYFRIYFIVT